MPEALAAEMADLGWMLDRAKAGDVEAFGRLIVAYNRQVLRTAMRLLGNQADAEDAAQEVFFRLHRHLRSFDEKRDFAAWLYRITVNVCRDLQRKRRRMEQLDCAPEPKASMNPTIENREFFAQALRRLTDKEKAAFTLRDLEGLETREVAAILGSSEATVRSQISTARAKIRALWRRK